MRQSGDVCVRMWCGSVCVCEWHRLVITHVAQLSCVLPRWLIDLRVCICNEFVFFSCESVSSGTIELLICDVYHIMSIGYKHKYLTILFSIYICIREYLRVTIFPPILYLCFGICIFVRFPNRFLVKNGFKDNIKKHLVPFCV